MTMLRFLFSLLLFLPAILLAHGIGQSLYQPVGPHIAELEYETFELIAGEEVTINFNLFSTTTILQPNITRVEAAIYREEKVLGRYTAEAREYLRPSIRLTFPRAGDYLVQAAYFDDAVLVTETSFPLTVSPAVWQKRLLTYGLPALKYGSSLIILIWFAHYCWRRFIKS
jgi:hypothetical protein